MGASAARGVWVGGLVSLGVAGAGTVRLSGHGSGGDSPVVRRAAPPALTVMAMAMHGKSGRQGLMSALIALAAATICVAHVSDGDTIRLCNGERVRLLGIDAPELRHSERCSARSRARLAGSRNPAWCDHAKGEASRAALARLMATGTVRIERRGTDVYKRTLARVTVNGRDAGEWLISQGLARPWR